MPRIPNVLLTYSHIIYIYIYIYIYIDLRYMQPFWIEMHCLFFAVVLIVRLRCTASHAGLHGECRLCVCVLVVR